MPVPAEAFSESSTTLCVVCILLVPLAGAGIALINTGLGRSRSAAQLMLSSLCVVSVAAIAYLACGFAFQGLAGQGSHVVMVGGKPWSWLARGSFFLHHVSVDGSTGSLVALLGMLGAGLAALIPLGAGADRWRLGAACISAAILGGFVYPLFSHWVW